MWHFVLKSVISLQQVPTEENGHFIYGFDLAGDGQNWKLSYHENFVIITGGKGWHNDAPSTTSDFKVSITTTLFSVIGLDTHITTPGPRHSEYIA